MPTQGPGGHPAPVPVRPAADGVDSLTLPRGGPYTPRLILPHPA